MSSYASLIAVAPRTNSKGTAVDSGFKAVIWGIDWRKYYLH
jgi:hypothetical protein